MISAASCGKAALSVAVLPMVLGSANVALARRIRSRGTRACKFAKVFFRNKFFVVYIEKHFFRCIYFGCIYVSILRVFDLMFERLCP